MRLYLMRHGVAVDREDSECPSEAERYLTPKGMEKTRAAAWGLRALGVKPEVMFTSPYLRAVQTAEIICEALGVRPGKLRRTDSLLPEGNPVDLFRDLGRLKASEVMCFGHAPNLDLVIAHALGTAHPVTALKKAGAACLELTHVAAGRGKVIWILTPKVLRNLVD